MGSDYGVNGLYFYAHIFSSGTGYVFIIERDESTGQLRPTLRIDYKDNFLDVCWSESDPNIFTASSGDGWIHVWNLGNKFPKVNAS